MEFASIYMLAVCPTVWWTIRTMHPIAPAIYTVCGTWVIIPCPCAS